MHAEIIPFEQRLEMGRVLAAIHAPSAKLISGESNIVEMLLQFPALLQHATATSADRNTAM